MAVASRADREGPQMKAMEAFVLELQVFHGGVIAHDEFGDGAGKTARVAHA